MLQRLLTPSKSPCDGKCPALFCIGCKNRRSACRRNRSTVGTTPYSGCGCSEDRPGRHRVFPRIRSWSWCYFLLQIPAKVTGSISPMTAALSGNDLAVQRFTLELLLKAAIGLLDGLAITRRVDERIFLPVLPRHFLLQGKVEPVLRKKHVTWQLLQDGK